MVDTSTNGDLHGGFGQIVGDARDKRAMGRAEAFDSVEKPAHYASGDIECIDAIKAQMTPEEFQGYLKGNVSKYMWRWRDKGGVESLRKARWYLERLISTEI